MYACILHTVQQQSTQDTQYCRNCWTFLLQHKQCNCNFVQFYHRWNLSNNAICLYRILTISGWLYQNRRWEKKVSKSTKSTEPTKSTITRKHISIFQNGLTHTVPWKIKCTSLLLLKDNMYIPYVRIRDWFYSKWVYN